MYIVMGSAGEYSDRSEWPVVAYTDEALAQQHVLLATEKAREIQSILRGIDGYPEYHNPYDAGMYLSYTGASYFIYTVPTADALPVVSADFQLVDCAIDALLRGEDT